MTAYQYIEKNRPDPEGLDFEGLKKEGVHLLHQLCGKTWTDFNLHDPGVTILEQLCYALTELKFRTEFDTVDYLTGPDGTVNFTKQALYRPEEILPCRPITINDYRKLLCDRLPEVDDIWFEDAQSEYGQGLFCVHVWLKETKALSADKRHEMSENIKAIYAANRNLCEDLEAVHYIKPRFYTLHGMVEVEGRREPEEILAEIYFKAAKHISPGIVFHPYEKAIREGQRLEDILVGPLTEHGYAEDQALNRRRTVVTISELIGIIKEIAGVKYVENLWFENAQDRTRHYSIACDPSLKTAPCLKFPKQNGSAIVLNRNGREYSVSLKAARVELEWLNTDYESFRYKRRDIADLLPLPQGEFRSFQSYHSIQNDFPGIYGIGPSGLPESAPTKRKAQARQLKTYLLLFEQVMANFLANVQNITRLFSTDEQLDRSYFSQSLSKVPGVEGLLQDKAEQGDAEISKIVSRYDPFSDRRNRVLDYLLGIYGEKYTQNALRRFNCYHSDEEMGRELIRNKLAFLKHFVEISRERTSAFDYRRSVWDSGNMAGIQKKAGILLGLEQCKNRSLAGVFHTRQLTLIPDDEFEKALHPEYRDADVVRRDFTKIPPLQPETIGERPSLEPIVCLQKKLISESILKSGVALEKYRVGLSAKEKSFDLVLKSGSDDRWCCLGAYGTEEEAFYAANQLRAFLIDLNRAGEGLHLVEHILLRPLSGKTHEIAVPDDFYTFRISVVFPSWTARFDDPEFRKFARETIELNCPAHVLPVFYWLNIDQMQTFETLYTKWLADKCEPGKAAGEIDKQSQALIVFLREHLGGSQK